MDDTKKSSCNRKSLSLCNTFNIQPASRNVFSEFIIIHKAIGCGCNCCHLYKFLGETAISILPESSQLPPTSEFVTEERQESRGLVNTF